MAEFYYKKIPLWYYFVTNLVDVYLMTEIRFYTTFFFIEVNQMWNTLPQGSALKPLLSLL